MKRYQKIALSILVPLVIGYLLPERIRIPVVGATQADWNRQAFWHEPWGSSGVHKGIDIFGALGTGVTSTTDGMVIYTGEHAKGGSVIVVLGPKWRFHYFAHLNSIDISMFSFVKSGEKIGTLGDSGNARGKPPHLHYSIVRLIPAPWAIDSSTQGYKKALYIDPSPYLGG